MTALILAVLNQSTEMTKLLLEQGALIIDLAEAVSVELSPVFLILIHYLYCNCLFFQGGMTALMVAAELGFTEIVQLLLANGASVHTLCKVQVHIHVLHAYFNITIIIV